MKRPVLCLCLYDKTKTFLKWWCHSTTSLTFESGNKMPFNSSNNNGGLQVWAIVRAQLCLRFTPTSPIVLAVVFPTLLLLFLCSLWFVYSAQALRLIYARFMYVNRLVRFVMSCHCHASLPPRILYVGMSVSSINPSEGATCNSYTGWIPWRREQFFWEEESQ